MDRRRRFGARALGLVVVASCALALAACVTPPDPARHCVDAGAQAQDIAPEVQDRLDLYGIWSPVWDDSPPASGLDHPAAVPFGFDPGRRVWLTPFLLAPGTSGRVSIVKPRDARLFVSTWERWGSLTAPELQTGMARGIDLVGCDGVASFPALTIVDGPACVVYSVRLDGDDRLVQIPVPFFGAQC